MRYCRRENLTRRGWEMNTIMKQAYIPRKERRNLRHQRAADPAEEDQGGGGKGLHAGGGEGSGDTRDAENRFTMKKTADFPGWEAWKKLHKEGLECSVRFLRKGGKITVSTETLGIAIEHTLLLHDKTAAVYAALTGYQVALTDIRVR